MIYELRIYTATPGRLPDIVAAFATITQNLGAVWHPAGWFLDHAGWAEQQHVNLSACVGDSRRTRGEMERVYC